MINSYKWCTVFFLSSIPGRLVLVFCSPTLHLLFLCVQVLVCVEYRLTEGVPHSFSTFFVVLLEPGACQCGWCEVCLWLSRGFFTVCFVLVFRHLLLSSSLRHCFVYSLGMGASKWFSWHFFLSYIGLLFFNVSTFVIHRNIYLLWSPCSEAHYLGWDRRPSCFHLLELWLRVWNHTWLLNPY